MQIGMLFEPSNRGNIFVLTRMNDVPALNNNNNPTTAQDFGNGFLLRQGYTIAWVGWEADVKPGSNRLTVQNFPIAVQGGKPISERILVEFFNAKGAATGVVFTRPLRSSNNLNIKPYEAVSTDQTVAMAELRMRPSDSPRPPALDIP